MGPSRVGARHMAFLKFAPAQAFPVPYLQNKGHIQLRCDPKYLLLIIRNMPHYLSPSYVRDLLESIFTVERRNANTGFSNFLVVLVIRLIQLLCIFALKVLIQHT